MAKRDESARAEVRSYFTPAEVAARFEVGIHAVLKFIATGELVALNLADRKARKPRWKISSQSIENFERSRSSTTAPAAPAPKRQPRQPKENFVEYF